MYSRFVAISFVAAGLSWSPLLSEAANIFRLKEGTPGIQSLGVATFGPRGVLFVGDVRSGAVFAIDTSDSEGDAGNASPCVNQLKKKLADLYEVPVDQVAINDLAVNSISGNVYLTLSIGVEGRPALTKIQTTGALEDFPLDKLWFSKAVLKDAPEDQVVRRGRRSRNLRDDAITDLAFVDGQLIISGLTNQDRASGVRALAFPFSDDAVSAALEIYHGAHGKFEDYSAIRTFVPFMINGEPNLLAGFVCTPLVRFPLESVKSGDKIEGTTIAELGNRNRPLDMFVYESEGKDYLLLSNSARGVMKISTDEIESRPGITERVGRGGTAGQPYETIQSLKDVVQMGRLNDTKAVVIIKDEDGGLNLSTVDLP